MYLPGGSGVAHQLRPSRRGFNIWIAVRGIGRKINVTVRDDGRGFDRDNAGGGGLGLIGMEERVRKLGGRLAILSDPKGGTILRVELPCGQEA